MPAKPEMRILFGYMQRHNKSATWLSRSAFDLGMRYTMHTKFPPYLNLTSQLGWPRRNWNF